GPPGRGGRPAVPLDHLVPRPGAEGRGGAGDRRPGSEGRLARPDRDRDCAARALRPGRGLPPRLLRAEPAPALLPDRDRPQGRQVPQGAPGAAQALSLLAYAITLCSPRSPGESKP